MAHRQDWLLPLTAIQNLAKTIHKNRILRNYDFCFQPLHSFVHRLSGWKQGFRLLSAFSLALTINTVIQYPRFKI